MKAVSTIIASIMLVIITIGLVSTAYLYIIGIFGGQTSKTIKLVEADAHMIIFQNLGSDTIASDEIRVLVNGEQVELTNPQAIEPKDTVTLKFVPPELEIVAAKVNLIGPSNSLNYVTDIIPNKFKVTSGTVGLWHFEGDAEDETEVNPGVINGADCDVDGKFGRGCNFDGDDDSIEVLDSPSLSPTDQVSVECWVKWYALETVGLVWKHSYNYVLHGPEPSGFIKFDVWDTDSDRSEANFSQDLITVGQFHHVVGVFGSDHRARIYLDGEVVGNVGDPIDNIRDQPGNLYVGERHDLIGEVYFDGIIDEVAISNRGVTQEEILDRIYA